MYFQSVLPLLLFASAICASPVHIGRRMIIMGVELPDNDRNNLVYELYSESTKLHGKPFEGVEGALKVESEANKMTYMRVEVTAAGVRTVKTIIDHLGPVFHRWGWNKVVPNHRIAFVLEMNQVDEEKVRQRWRQLTHADMTSAMGNLHHYR